MDDIVTVSRSIFVKRAENAESTTAKNRDDAIPRTERCNFNDAAPTFDATDAANQQRQNAASLI